MITLSVGIPTFNESANIKKLITGLLAQQISGFKLDKVIVSDDMSTDGTQGIVASIKNKKVLLLASKKRQGIAKRLNQIFRTSSSDYLLILNGDVFINDKSLFKKIVSISTTNKFDLLSGDLKEVESKNIISNSLAIARKTKDLIYESANSGDNWYTCHGPVRLFSKKLYSKLRLPFGVGEDLYSYYFCKKYGFKYGYTKDVTVLFKQPESLHDHIKQSTRFSESQKLIEKEFGSEFVVSIRPKVKLASIIKSVVFLASHPVSMFIYFTCLFYVRLKVFIVKNTDQRFDTWSIANSSKK